MTALQPSVTCATETNFAGMLSALRSIQPKCPDCSQPLDPSGLEVRRRETEAGKVERVCRPCFNGEVAEMLLAHQPR